VHKMQRMCHALTERLAGAAAHKITSIGKWDPRSGTYRKGSRGRNHRSSRDTAAAQRSLRDEDMGPELKK
jgi:hypothetical protein